MIDLNFISVFFLPEPVLTFLAKPIFTGIPELDYWLIFHFVAAFIGFILIKRFVDEDRAIKIVFSMIVIVELIEVPLMVQGLIGTETVIGRVLDIIVGLLGAMLANKITSKRGK